jgi:hypothetical protein
MKSMKLHTVCLVVVSASAVLFGSSAMSQSDSSNVPALRGTPIVPLRLQQRETPVVNNITQVTQVSSGMDGAYQSQSSNGGYSIAAAYASCGGGKVVSGGVSCGGFAVALASERQ